MQNLLDTITSIFLGTIDSQSGERMSNGIITWVGSVVDMIVDNDLILLFVVMAVALIAVGVVKRLIRL